MTPYATFPRRPLGPTYDPNLHDATEPTAASDMPPMSPYGPMAGPQRMNPWIRDRALDARQAAQFAASAPRPVDPTTARMRSAYVDRKQQEADLFGQQAGFGPNYFQGRQFAQDANGRANILSGAQADLMGDQGYRLRQEADVLMPSMASLNTANARHVTGMLPFEQRAMSASTDGVRANTAGQLGLNKMIGPYLQSNIDATNAATAERKAMLGPKMFAEVTNAGHTAELEGLRDKLFREQQDMLKTRLDNLMPTISPEQEGLENMRAFADTLRSIGIQGESAIPYIRQRFPQYLGPTMGPTPSLDGPAYQGPAAPPGDFGLMAPASLFPPQATSPSVSAPTTPGARLLTHDEAVKILAEAGGDAERARQIAKSRGYNTSRLAGANRAPTHQDVLDAVKVVGGDRERVRQHLRSQGFQI